MSTTAPDSLYDFTEAGYRRMLTHAVERFTLLPVREAAGRDPDGVAIWRHDIDLSPQRALAMARIEAALGVRSTFYVLLNGPFYNPLEPGIAALLNAIRALGHEIGLHFDASAEDDLGERMGLEAGMLGSLVGVPVQSFSVHNPSVSHPEALRGEAFEGLFNASHAGLRERFTYSSDSNGIWRYRPMPDVIADPEVRNVYALTHPEWWTPAAMPPAERLRRCIDGRAAAVAAEYLAFIGRHRAEVLPHVE